MASRPSNLIIREAQSALDIEAAQALRYQVFYEEMGAIPSPEVRRLERDYDRFDDVCDHLLAIDPARSNGRPFVVGCYRLLRKSVAERHGGFYTADEFDISSLMDYPGEVVEVGRSCVHRDYRTRAVLQQLWGGIADYLKRYRIGVLFGCASFPGTDPEAVTEQLSYLHHFHLAPAGLRPRALDHRYVEMAKIEPTWLDERKAITALPPLIKGYVRLGGFVGDGAVIDYQFNTTDVCIIVQTEHISAKYHRHYRPSGTL